MFAMKEEMEMRLYRLKRDLGELEAEKSKVLDNENFLESLRPGAEMINRESSDLIQDIAAAIECDGFVAGISPALENIGSGFSRFESQLCNQFYFERQQIESEIQNKLMEIHELEYRISLLKMKEFNIYDNN